MLRNRVKQLAKWLHRKLKPPCPSCGSKQHEHDYWQCATCLTKLPEDRISAECPKCHNSYIDSVRHCTDCGRVWNPRNRDMLKRISDENRRSC